MWYKPDVYFYFVNKRYKLYVKHSHGVWGNTFLLNELLLRGIAYQLKLLILVNSTDLNVALN